MRRQTQGRWFETCVACCACVLTLFASPGPALAGNPADCPAVEWPLWQAYVRQFVRDGRVIDRTADDITTSEGQSYALFFSLVTGDRGQFIRLLAWTENNLALGNLSENLPAYKWGRGKEGWGIVDMNSAADSDLWIAYTLLEAGRLWDEPGYGQLGRNLLAKIVAREVADLPGLGPMLLPAPKGFVLGKGTWRLNPSYLPPPLLRGLETSGAPGPWREIRQSTLRMIEARAQHGFVDDWVAYREGRGFITDPVSGSLGSYDAIRTYLWAGLTDDGEAGKQRLVDQLHGMLDHWRRTGEMPEKVDTLQARQTSRAGPVGFYAAILPSVHGQGNREETLKLNRALDVQRADGLYGQPPSYYDQNLLLFALGYVESRYRFDADGRLVVPWTCTPRQAGGQAPSSQ